MYSSLAGENIHFRCSGIYGKNSEVATRGSILIVRDTRFIDSGVRWFSRSIILRNRKPILTSLSYRTSIDTVSIITQMITI